MRKPIYWGLCSLLCAALLTGCTATAEQRTGQAEGYGGTLSVSVTVDGDDIKTVQVTSHSETQGVGTRAIDTLPELIAQQDSVEVDNVSGATMTSKAIKAAVRQALGMDDTLGDTIDMNGADATESTGITGLLSGVGMASTGRIGPGKDEQGNQVHSINIVFAAGQFDEDGRIRHIKVDQLEIGSPNMAEGNTFSGFPNEDGTQEDFMAEISSWVTKGALRDDYMLTSGSWRDQMDAYEQQFIGKTVDELESWYQTNFDTETGRPKPDSDAVTGATMSLRGEHGHILTAIRRAWKDAQLTGDESAPLTEPATPTDALTNTNTQSPDDNTSVG